MLRRLKALRPQPPLLEPHVHFETYDVEYAPGLLATVYKPDPALAAVLDVHGGDWVAGDRFQQHLLDQALAANGVLVAAIEYRLAPQHTYPAALQDVIAAAHWLRQLGADLPCGALGSSAGGHLAILAALVPDGANFDFVIADAPITDTESYAASHPFFRSRKDVEGANPLRHLNHQKPLPALLITHGSADRAVPLGMSRQFVERYPGQATLRVFEGLGHAFVLTHPRSREARQLARAVFSFIMSLR